MEHANFIISLPNKTIQLGILYQPHEGSILQFYQDLATYVKEDQDTITLLNTLKEFCLQNRVEFPTHQLQNTLDLIITVKILTASKKPEEDH